MSRVVTPAGTAALDRWLAKTPGLQYVAVTAEGIVAEYAGGFANLSTRSALERTTSMMAYSMSKTITAVGVLQLVAAGRIALDDPVDRYLAAVPYRGVTVRQLLSHTSGLSNPIPLRWVHLATSHDSFNEDGALAGIIGAHRRLSFRPGTRYRYSNIGYWLLGKLVERASGLSFTDYIGTYVVRPLGLSSRDLGYVIADPSTHAHGYLERWSLMNLVKGVLIDRELVGGSVGRWTEIRPHYVNGPAFGGLIGTARAFGVFLRDQLRERSVLLDADTKALLYDTRRAATNFDVPMTLGWHVGGLGGDRYFYKEGGGGGFRCLMRLYPSRGLGTVVMTNATACPVHRVLDDADSPAAG